MDNTIVSKVIFEEENASSLVKKIKSIHTALTAVNKMKLEGNGLKAMALKMKLMSKQYDEMTSSLSKQSNAPRNITEAINQSVIQQKSLNSMINDGVHNYDKMRATQKKLDKAKQIRQTTQANKKLQEQIKLTKERNLAQNKFASYLKKGQNAQMDFNGSALSTMFFGMAIQRVFTSATKAIFEGYKKALPEGHKFNMMTNTLSANWEFFKFQLADALANSSLFQSFIGYLINILKWLQQLSPETKKWIVILTAVAAAFGGIMFSMATIKLGLAGLVDEMELFNDTTGKFSWGKIGKIGIMSAVIAALAVAAYSMKKFSESSDYGKEAVSNLGDGFKSLINSALTPLGEMFGNMDFEIKDFNELMVFLGSIVTTVMGAIGNIVNALVLIWRVAWNAIQNSFGLFVNWLIGKAETVIDSLHYIALAVDYVFGKDFSSYTSSAQAGLESLKWTTDDFADNMLDIDDAFTNFQDTFVEFANTTTNPFTAVEEYRKELARVDQLEKSRNFMSGLEKNVSMVSTPGRAEASTTVNNNVVVIEQMDDALAMSAINKEQYDAFKQVL